MAHARYQFSYTFYTRAHSANLVVSPRLIGLHSLACAASLHHANTTESTFEAHLHAMGQNLY